MKGVLICMAFATLLLCLNDSHAAEKIVQETKGDQSPAVNVAPGGSSSITYQSAAPIIDGSLKPLSSISSDFITVYLGNSLTTYPRERLVKGLPLNVLDSFIQQDAKHDLIIKLRENKLLVSATVYSLDKKIVAKLDDNEWAINEHNYFRRNYDDSSLEVIDQFHGFPALQVTLIDNDSFRICGVFVSGESLLIVHDEGFTLCPLPADLDLRKVMATNKITFTRIFAYGENSLGKRTEYGARLLGELQRLSSLKTVLQAKYSSLDNQQLVREAVVFAQTLREFAKSRQKFPLETGAAVTGEESSRLLLKAEEEALKDYKDKFRTEACSLRNEIVRRLHFAPDARTFVLYENANNTIVIGLVANSLSGLAAALSSQSSKFLQILRLTWGKR